MMDVVVSIGVVVAILSVVSSLFALYVWRAAPDEFARWKRSLRSRQPGTTEALP